MTRVVICFLIVLLTSSFKPKDSSAELEDRSLLSRIKKAREVVKDERTQLLKGIVGTRRVRVGRHKFQDIPIEGIVGREMALAIMSPEGEIRIARAIKRDDGLEVLTQGFVISMRRENGINTDFACIT